MNFKALKREVAAEGDLDDDLERLGRPGRRARKAAPSLEVLPRIEGPGRYVSLGWDEPLTIKAHRYLDPDGVVRYRAHLPGGSYAVVLERDATEDERASAAREGAGR